MSENYNSQLIENNDIDFKIIGLNTDRELLYERINKRVDLMMGEGLIEEVITLLLQFDKRSHGFKAIGYREVIDYLEGLSTREEMIHLIKRNSRRYAKRQITWFKRDPRILWVDLVQEYEKSYKIIKDFINEK